MRLVVDRANARPAPIYGTRFFAELALACAALFTASCGDRSIDTSGLDDLPDAGADAAVADDGGIGTIGGRASLTVTGIAPSSGPFAGGNTAIVRGSRFSDEALVRVGGRMVQPSDTVRLDSNSLSIVLPAGDVGSADVTVIDGEDEVTREAAYTYNPLLIEPTEGSVAGGTSVLITVHGATFGPSARVDIGDAACTDVRLITPSSLRCKTPEGEVGQADVVVRGGDEGDVPALVATDAFEYLDFTDTQQSGLSGGPIQGSLNITIIDSMIGLVIPNVYVLVGDDVSSPFQGRTNDRGQITFSNDDLEGPVTIHAAIECFERVSIVSFDARNVTIELTPLLDPTCGEPGELGPGNGRGMAGAEIAGELVFPGSDEFSVNPWDIVPEPRANEQRVAYVFTTQARIESPNPPPSLSDGIARIVEETSTIGTRGFPYRIFARPAGLAVYAIAGLERRDSGELTPYVMGVTRDLITAPGEILENVDIEMVLPLDRKLDVELATLPERTPRGPMELRVEAHLDLGGEGVIVRVVNDQLYDRETSFTADALSPFFAQPPLIGGLEDARYELIAGYYTTDSDQDPPFTMLRRRGVLPQSTPELVDDLLGVPVAVEPLEGASLSADRVLRWELAGTQPDFWIISIRSGTSVQAWTQIVPGSQSASVLPNLAEIPEVGDVSEGLLFWSIEAARMPDFVYDELKLNQLAGRFLSHIALNNFTMQR